MEVLKNIGWTLLDIVLFVLGFGLLAFLMVSIIHVVYPMDGGGDVMNNPFVLFVQYFPMLIASIVSGIVVHKYIFSRPMESFGIGLDSLFIDYSKGWLLGFFLIALGFLTLRFTGVLDIIDYHMEYGIIAMFLLFFIVQSLFEEIAFRSYLMPAISSRFGIWAALIVSSILFAAIHLTNSNVSTPGIINIGLAGVLLGLLFIKFNNVWMAAGFHCSWNYVQSTLLGFEVSGEKTFNMIETQEVGPDLITGGKFGFEGSIVAVFFLAALILYYIFRDKDVRMKLGLEINNV